MSMTDERVNEILRLRDSGRVKRWHTVATIKEQTVAEHCGQCLSLLLTLHPDPSVRLIKALTWHDCAEIYTGDLPAMVKREREMLAEEVRMAERAFYRDHAPTVGQIIRDLTPDEKAWLKAIDVLELVLWCSDEVALGNARIAVSIERGISYLSEMEDCPQEVMDFVNSIVREVQA